jgi:hypothetical protein
MKKVFVVALMVLLTSSFTTVKAQYKGKFEGWSTGYCFSSSTFIPSDFGAFTHLINYAATISANQAVVLTGLSMNSQTFVDACHMHGVKALVCVGGPGEGAHFASACSSATAQTLLIKNILGLVRQYNYDGVDIDWEEGISTPSVFTAFFKQVRDSIDAMTVRPVLTAACAYWYWSQFVSIAPYVDQLNCQTYSDSVKNIYSQLSSLFTRGVKKSVLGISFGWELGNYLVTDPGDILAKCRYAIDSGYGGISAWRIAQAPLITPWILDSISRYVRPFVPPPHAPLLAWPYNNMTDLPPDLSISWSSVAGVSTYRIQLSMSGTFSSAPLVDSVLSGTMLDVTGLAANTSYFWRVLSMGSTSSSGWSDTWTFTTRPATSALAAKSEVFISGMNAASGSVRFSVSKASRVIVRLYSVSGTLLETVCNSLYAPGLYRISLKSSRLATGNYLLDFGDGTYGGGARKMIVLQ